MPEPYIVTLKVIECISENQSQIDQVIIFRESLPPENFRLERHEEQREHSIISCTKLPHIKKVPAYYFVSYQPLGLLLNNPTKNIRTEDIEVSSLIEFIKELKKIIENRNRIWSWTRFILGRTVMVSEVEDTKKIAVVS